MMIRIKLLSLYERISEERVTFFASLNDSLCNSFASQDAGFELILILLVFANYGTKSRVA